MFTSISNEERTGEIADGYSIFCITSSVYCFKY